MTFSSWFAMIAVGVRGGLWGGSLREWDGQYTSASGSKSDGAGWVWLRKYRGERGTTQLDSARPQTRSARAMGRKVQVISQKIPSFCWAAVRSRLVLNQLPTQGGGNQAFSTHLLSPTLTHGIPRGSWESRAFRLGSGH